MKITIESETDQEKMAMKEPFVREGCIRLCAMGIVKPDEENKTGEFGFLHGENAGVRGDVARLTANLDMQAARQASFEGLVHAQQAMVNAQRNAALEQEIISNRNGKLRIHRE